MSFGRCMRIEHANDQQLDSNRHGSVVVITIRRKGGKAVFFSVFGEDRSVEIQQAGNS